MKSNIPSAFSILSLNLEDPSAPLTVFSAAGGKEISSSWPEKKHGLFSYYLMKGLQGNADENGNKRITNNELIAYLKTNVSREAFSQAREQDPMLSGDPEQVLMVYR